LKKKMREREKKDTCYQPLAVPMGHGRAIARGKKKKKKKGGGGPWFFAIHSTRELFAGHGGGGGEKTTQRGFVMGGKKERWKFRVLANCARRNPPA